MTVLFCRGELHQRAVTHQLDNPAVIQAAGSLVHVTYSWNLSRIKHVTIGPMNPTSPLAR